MIFSGNYTKKERTDMTSLQKRFIPVCAGQARLNETVGQATPVCHIEMPAHTDEVQPSGNAKRKTELSLFV